MMLEPGKLYKINEWCWLLFPTKKAAVIGSGIDPGPRTTINYYVSYWSKELNCTVSLLDKGDIFMVVKISNYQVAVINQQGKSGWINFPADEEWAGRCIVACDARPP